MAVVLLILLTGCVNRPTQRFLVPMGYVGWINVKYKVPGEPALPVKNDIATLKIPRSGRLQTSTYFKGSSGYDDYYYSSPSGRLQKLPDVLEGNKSMVWGGSYVGLDNYFVFIGTEKQFEAAGPVGGATSPGARHSD